MIILLARDYGTAATNSTSGRIAAANWFPSWAVFQDRTLAGRAMLSRQSSLVMVVEEFCQLLAQAFVLLALMTEYHGAFEQPVLQVLRQFTPQVCGCSAEHQEIARGQIVDDLVGMLAHRRAPKLDP
jgi:hypothetical protein